MQYARNIAVLVGGFVLFNVLGAQLLYRSQSMFRYESSSDTPGSEIFLAVVSNIPLFLVLVPVSLLVAWLVRPKAQQTSAIVLSALALVTFVLADPVARNPLRFGFQLAVGTLLSGVIFVALIFFSFFLIRRRMAAV
jgi:hypothetical protein